MTRYKRIIGIIVLLFFSVLEILMVCKNPFSELELYSEDLLYQNVSGVPDDIKIIAIDEETLSDLGPYNQWDRKVFARLIDTIYSVEGSEPKVLAFDIMFSGTNDSESDRMLYEAAARHSNIVCASKIEVSNKTSKVDGKYYGKNYISSEITAYENLDKVTKRGFVTPVFDKDGYTRRAYSSINSEGNEYVSFSLQVARLAGFEGQLSPIYEFLYSGNPGDFEIIPMSKVLDGTIKPTYLKDSILLVGAYEEGMMDSYSVPVNHARNMYGVEIQANEVAAILQNKMLSSLSTPVMCIVAVSFLLVFGFFIIRTDDVKNDLLFLLGSVISYGILCLVLKSLNIKVQILYFPLCIFLLFLTDFVIEYILSQKERADEMQRLLFSMADSMAEAIEGRTPYNANHTKNVAKRSVMMLDYINELHKQKKTDMHFTPNDRKQLYLASMLHDIGKMDVPLEVMDKPTRLGNKIRGLVDRLLIIKLHLMVDGLEGRKTTDFVSKEISDIDSFLNRLDGFDCGRPLKEDEVAFIDDLSKRWYEGEEKIPYITIEELNDLHIKAGTLSDEEREIMKSHVVYTDRILSHIDFGKEFDRVRKMASDHHELMNGQGYPLGKTSEDIDTLTRILTIMDIYDSLIADDRPYKKPKSPQVAFEILEEEASKGKVDKELLDIAKELFLNN